MKKFLLLGATLGLLMTFNSCKKKDKDPEPQKEEFLASTTPSNRVALLEDFTGVRCGYCPDGHRIANEIEAANQEKFVVIATHAGSYAAPMAGWANLTTAYGTALVSQAKITGFPSGTMNRIACSELGVNPMTAGGTGMGRGSWTNAANKVMTFTAPVNIGSKATFNESTRELTVKVDLYYTEEQTGENNINVALVQDHIFTKQSGGTPDANNYEQNHVLRDYLTGQWGDPVTETKAVGTKISKTYTYKVPEDYNGATIPPGGGPVVIDDLKVIVFVSAGKTNVLNATEVDVK